MILLIILSGGKTCLVIPGVSALPWATQTVLSPLVGGWWGQGIACAFTRCIMKKKSLYYTKKNFFTLNKILNLLRLVCWIFLLFLSSCQIYRTFHFSIYIFIYKYTCVRVCDSVLLHSTLRHRVTSLASSSSSCRATSKDIHNPLSPLLPIGHRLWKVFWATSRILT